MSCFADKHKYVPYKDSRVYCECCGDVFELEPTSYDEPPIYNPTPLPIKHDAPRKEKDVKREYTVDDYEKLINALDQKIQETQDEELINMKEVFQEARDAVQDEEVMGEEIA